MRERPSGVGLRAQLAIALVTVLALAAVLANLAIRPLTAATSRAVRKRAGVTLVRAVAGQIALLPEERAAIEPLVRDTVGEGALHAAAVLDARGAVIAQSGRFADPMRLRSHEALVDRLDERGTMLWMQVAIPRGGAFVAEVSLAQSSNERGLVAGMLLYTLVASSAALFVLYALLTRYTVRPLEALTAAAERVANGSRNVRVEARGAREIARASVAFNAMTEDLASRESELEEKVRQLEQALLSLEETTQELRTAQSTVVRSERLAVVGRLAAGIAHEVGNPLAAIVGLADVLGDGGLDDSEVQDFSRRIGKEAQRIHRTVRELLDYARARPEQGERHASGSLDEAIDQVKRLLAPQPSMKQITLHIENTSEITAVSLDNDRLVQVLLNLVLNAADAIRGGREGEGRGDIWLSVQREEHNARVIIEDNGPGIESALREKIFEPFFTTRPAGEGTGLGLAICASIVEQASGTLRAVDRPGGEQGARIELTLPQGESMCVK
ncbi:MAG: ATP-binding protein [Deltaproteobacteria bacterium]|nr:ATP-binding protein [Deltaproteobacteria bacterium]